MHDIQLAAIEAFVKEILDPLAWAFRIGAIEVREVIELALCRASERVLAEIRRRFSACAITKEITMRRHALLNVET